jgi:hypothetical protein
MSVLQDFLKGSARVTEKAFLSFFILFYLFAIPAYSISWSAYFIQLRDQRYRQQQYFNNPT